MGYIKLQKDAKIPIKQMQEFFNKQRLRIFHEGEILNTHVAQFIKL